MKPISPSLGSYIQVLWPETKTLWVVVQTHYKQFGTIISTLETNKQTPGRPGHKQKHTMGCMGGMKERYSVTFKAKTKTKWHRGLLQRTCLPLYTKHRRSLCHWLYYHRCLQILPQILANINKQNLHKLYQKNLENTSKIISHL